MKKYLGALKKCPLFAGFDEADITAMLSCLNAKEVRTKKNEVVFAAGDRPEYVGIVLEGSVHIVQEDYWGNRMILAAIEAGGIFGEAFSCAETAVLPVSVLTHDSGAVLLIDCRKILTTCSSACLFHARLIRNLMKILANKNIALTRKMEHVTKKNNERQGVVLFIRVCLDRGNKQLHHTLQPSRASRLPFGGTQRLIQHAMQNEG